MPAFTTPAGPPPPSLRLHRHRSPTVTGWAFGHRSPGGRSLAIQIGSPPPGQQSGWPGSQGGQLASWPLHNYGPGWQFAVRVSLGPAFRAGRVSAGRGHGPGGHRATRWAAGPQGRAGTGVLAGPRPGPVTGYGSGRVPGWVRAGNNGIVL